MDKDDTDIYCEGASEQITHSCSALAVSCSSGMSIFFPKSKASNKRICLCDFYQHAVCTVYSQKIH